MQRQLLTCAGLLALAVKSLLASSICPAPNGGSVGGEGVSATYIANTVISGGVVQNNTGCNVLITFNLNGSVTTTFPNAAVSYDAGSEDSLIGIVNNTSSTIFSLNLSSVSQAIFGFDLDGVCGSVTGAQTTTSPGFTFVGGGNPCTSSTDPSGYGGPNTAFHPTTTSRGSVSFGATGIVPGQGTWFSLEGPVDVNIAATTGVPEPGTIGLLLSGFTALYFIRRRRTFA